MARNFIRERIDLIRSFYTQYKIDGYFIPSFDQYQSEFCPAFARRLEYATGFCGSHGYALITKEKIIITDSRYINQAQKELQHLDAYIVNIRNLDVLTEHIKGLIIGYDAALFTPSCLERFSCMNFKSVCSFDVGVVEVSKSILLRNKRHCPSSADPPCQQKKASKTRRRTPRAQWAPPASRTFGDFWMGWSMMVPKVVISAENKGIHPGLN